MVPEPFAPMQSLSSFTVFRSIKKKKNAPSLNSTFHVTFNIPNLRGRVIIKLKQIKLSLSISYFNKFQYFSCKKENQTGKKNLKIGVCLF